MDEAVASKRNEVGLRIAPTRERLRPLARATEVEVPMPIMEPMEGRRPPGPPMPPIMPAVMPAVPLRVSALTQ
jgi:hypothetical protein